MISFRATDEEQAFIDLAKNIAVQKIRPLIINGDLEAVQYEEVIQQIKELGLFNLELQESWHGLELPLVTQVQILQSLSYGDLDFVQSLPDAGDAASFIRLLPENQPLRRLKDQFLLQEMNAIACVVVEQKESPILHVEKTRNRLLLHGKTPPVRLGEACNLAVFSIKDTAGHHLIFYLEIPDDWKVPVENRLGLVNAKLTTFNFNQVEIPEEQVLARGAVAEDIDRKARARIHILQAAKEVGLAQAALDYTTEYTATRKAFGKVIAQFQGVSFQIAEMAIEVKAAEKLVLAAAFAVDQNEPLAISYARRALNRAHRALRFATDRAVQLLGGHGYIREYPVEKWMRDAQAQVLLYGRESEHLHEYGQWLVTQEKEVASR